MPRGCACRSPSAERLRRGDRESAGSARPGRGSCLRLTGSVRTSALVAFQAHSPRVRCRQDQSGVPPTERRARTGQRVPCGERGAGCSALSLRSHQGTPTTSPSSPEPLLQPSFATRRGLRAKQNSRVKGDVAKTPDPESSPSRGGEKRRVPATTSPGHRMLLGFLAPSVPSVDLRARSSDHSPILGSWGPPPFLPGKIQRTVPCLLPPKPSPRATH